MADVVDVADVVDPVGVFGVENVVLVGTVGPGVGFLVLLKSEKCKFKFKKTFYLMSSIT